MKLLSEIFRLLDELWQAIREYRAWLRIQYEMDRAWNQFQRRLGAAVA